MKKYRDVLYTFYFMCISTTIKCNFYSDRYDNFDIVPLLENDRILASYMNCFLDHGPCTPDAKDFKRVIPEALQTQCGKCTPKQSELIKSVIKSLKARHPESWEELLDKYDKDRLYRDQFNEYLEKYIQYY